MDQESIEPSEIGQTQKDMFSLCEIPRIGRFLGTESRLEVTKVGGEKGDACLLQGFCLGGWVLAVNSSSGHTTS